MNKRHYEHTLPNIRGSLSNTYPPCDKSHPYPVRHGHACITPKIQKT